MTPISVAFLLMFVDHKKICSLCTGCINLDVDVDPKTSCEQLIYVNQNLNKKQRQQMVLYYLTKVLSKPVIEDNFIDSIEENK